MKTIQEYVIINITTYILNLIRTMVTFIQKFQVQFISVFANKIIYY